MIPVPVEGDSEGKRVRFCGLCAKNVYNLSEMTRAEATSFVESVEGGTACVRFYKREDGTMLTSDCPVGVRRRVRRRIVGVAAMAVSALGIGGLYAFAAKTECKGAMPRGQVVETRGQGVEQGSDRQDPRTFVMGGIRPVRPEPRMGKPTVP